MRRIIKSLRDLLGGGLIDYPLRTRGVEVARANFTIIVRERGKIVPRHCRHNHNIWVTLGREYLARVIAPNDTVDDHYAETPPASREFLKFIALGIGGDAQTNPMAYQSPLKDDYPPATGTAPGGDGNKFTDSDLTVTTLERPVALSWGAAAEKWLGVVATPVTFPIATTLKLTRLYTSPELNQVLEPGSPHNYTIVPVSEAGLCLSTQPEEAAKTTVYDAGAPAYIAASRQKVCAYNTFTPIPITTAFDVELRWELRFG